MTEETAHMDRQFCDDCKRPYARTGDEWLMGFARGTASLGDYCGMDVSNADLRMEVNCAQAAWSNAVTAERNTSRILFELHGYVAVLCKLLGSDPAEVACDVWHLRDLILRQQGQIDRLRRVEEALLKLDSVLGVRFSFMHQGTHWKENPLDPTSIVLLASKLDLLRDGDGSEFLQTLQREAEERLRAALSVPPAERCGICKGSGNVERYVLPNVTAPVECKACGGSGRRPT